MENPGSHSDSGDGTSACFLPHPPSTWDKRAWVATFKPKIGGSLCQTRGPCAKKGPPKTDFGFPLGCPLHEASEQKRQVPGSESQN